MRGLPPVPSGVGELTQSWEIGGHVMSTSWWVLINLPIPYTALQLETILSDYTLYALPSLLDITTDRLSPDTCRLSANGITVVQKNPPAHGPWSGTLAVNTASGITWRTGDPGRKGWAITYVPGCPDAFVELGYQLSATGWSNILDAATNFRLNMRSLPSFPPDTVVMGVLLRSESGAPRPTSVFRPFIDQAPSPKVVTIRRRVPPGRNVLPF